MKGRYLMAICALFAIAAAVLASMPTADGQNATLRGYVTDMYTEEPVYDAMVSAWSDDPEVYNASWTDVGGYYEMGLEDRLFNVSVMAMDYAFYEGVAEVAGETWYNVSLIPYVMLEGYVLDDATDEPIEGVGIHLWNETEEGGGMGMTNETGYYYVSLLPDDYTLLAMAEGYRSHEEHLGVFEDMWYNFTLVPPSVLVMGYVTDGSGYGLPGANVSLYQGELMFWFKDETNGSGFYTLLAFEGIAHVSAFLDGYMGDMRYEEVSGDVFWINLTLERYVNITVMGFVTDGNGTAVHEAGVWFEGPGFGYNLTDGEGYYEVHLAATGGYVVEASGFEVGEFRGFIEFDEEGTYWYNITLSGNGSACEWYHVTGFVRDGDSEAPVEGAHVEVDSDKDYNHTYTDAEGGFHVGIEACDFINVEIHANGYYADWWWFDAEDINETFWLERANASTYWVKGSVYDDETEGPIEGAMVQAISDVGYNHTLTDSEGWYYLEIMAEAWIEVTASAEGYLDESWEFDAENVHEDLYLKMAPENGTVKGYVTDDAGEGIANITGAIMTMFGEQQHDPPMNITDEDGYFEFDAPGMAALIIAMDMYWRYMPYMHAIIVPEGGVLWYNITLYGMRANTSIIRGIVKSNAGAVVEGARVVAMPLLAGSLMQIMNPMNFSTDAEGHYEIPVPAGEYVVAALAEDLDEWHLALVTVAANETIWHNVSMVEYVNDTWIEINFETWEEGHGKMVMRTSGFGDFFSRLMIDVLFGDADGNVTAEELEPFAKFFEDEMMDDIEEEFEEEDSSDHFTVDGVNFTQEFVGIYICGLGAVDSMEPIEIKMVFDITANGDIADATTHTALINVTREDEESPTTFDIGLPAGFWLDTYDAPEGVSVSGAGTIWIELADGSEGGWTTLNLTSEGGPDAVTLAEPVVEMTTVSLSWTGYTGEDFHKYEVFKSTEAGKLGEGIWHTTDVGVTVYDVVGLMQGETYHFTVRVYDDEMRYADSNQVSAEIEQTSTPGFDVFVTVTIVGDDPKEGQEITLRGTIHNLMEESVDLTVTSGSTARRYTLRP